MDHQTVRTLEFCVLWYFLLTNSFYALLLILSIPEIYRRYKELVLEDLDALLHSEVIPPFTIIVPAHNERRTIIESVKSMLCLTYWRVDVVVVNDGSTDGTLDDLIREFELFQVPPAVPVKVKTKTVNAYYRSKREPRLYIIDKEKGGKSDALNAGINACTTPFFLTVDADTIIEQDALLRMIRPVLTRKNTVAAGGTVRVANNCVIRDGRVVTPRLPGRLLPGIQVVEYLRAFLFGRLGWNKLGGNLVVSGAFGLFNKDAVLKAGCYSTDSIGEDIELVVRLHRTMRNENIPYRIEFIPDPVAWTEVPTNLHNLRRQRERWQRGLIDTLMRYRSMMFNPRYGIVGMVSLPFYLVAEMLSPLVELFCYGLIFFMWLEGILDWYFFFLFFGIAWGFSVILTFFSILMEESTFKKYTNFRDLTGMMFYAFAETLGFRQLVLLYRIEAFWKYLVGSKGWGTKK